MNFTFRGSRSTLKLNDGSVVYLNPREKRINEGMKVLSEQLYQIMRYGHGIGGVSGGFQ